MSYVFFYLGVIYIFIGTIKKNVWKQKKLYFCIGKDF